MMTMMRFQRRMVFILAGCGALVTGCGTADNGQGFRLAADHAGSNVPIVRVACVYDFKPWLNLDAEGDRDPEGMEFRVFLDPGTGKGVLRDGALHIKMFALKRDSSGKRERRLVSDWTYSTDTFPVVRSRLLGMGYHVGLRWASKDIAGKEIEIVTRYEDPSGHVVSAGTKRFQVPQYVF